MVETSPQPGDRFALGTLADGDREFPALVVGEHVLDLSQSGVLDHPSDGSVTLIGILESWDLHLSRLVRLAAETGLPWTDLSGFTLRAPLRPGQVLQSGANYRTHVIDLAVAHRAVAGPEDEAATRAEVGAMMDRRAAEGAPYLFTGLPSAVAGPYDDLVLPGYSDKHDWELELAAVIGRPAFRLSREQALDCVAGYTIANDITTRDLVFRADMPEIGTDWLRAKNAPGFLPLEPYLVPAHCVADPTDLRVRLAVNGETMQDETTKDMLFDVAALVAAASQTVRLAPGDLVLTGSPAGNGMATGRFLREGDVMEGSITGLGSQRTVCRAER
ncbi:2-keto-4-pentenoate hydratase/2-oxohepta-3-ene-1,7-dioic acid hydratase in catechol pathway [Spinactinospora alkalitolerans]|uniref:2-keto-4-pentenoate hydratase/2-oxohepta-3-ene-1,7-dioic acid hydratase in catechol pathway n=1 Tax=Spinactinospora alkalitolerans TaxID=687207 RepID=A0A852TZ98_9ACTN|nr:fumarylacetoacetate hydrolase family protein [Spinactinospora alkalitolerans]NYE47120.1 2-keto-4-pentenoate hydratase/2-oxohepta-3-ene-1,7-dioic acid hydratase in catechol pathway [Spinactinospora alkalitolerans]